MKFLRTHLISLLCPLNLHSAHILKYHQQLPFVVVTCHLQHITPDYLTKRRTGRNFKPLPLVTFQSNFKLDAAYGVWICLLGGRAWLAASGLCSLSYHKLFLAKLIVLNGIATGVKKKLTFHSSLQRMVPKCSHQRIKRDLTDGLGAKRSKGNQLWRRRPSRDLHAYLRTLDVRQLPVKPFEIKGPMGKYTKRQSPFRHFNHKWCSHPTPSSFGWHTASNAAPLRRRN